LVCSGSGDEGTATPVSTGGAIAAGAGLWGGGGVEL